MSEDKPKKDELDERVEDNRLEYVSGQVIRTMRLKSDKWNKLMATEELKV